MLPAVVEEELRLLELVLERLGPLDLPDALPDYDGLLTTLRDAVAAAKPEDLPPLVEQMHTLAALAQQHGRGRALSVDRGSPYFGHLRLRERGRSRDVLIGRATHIDARRGIRVVDWRNAPVSRLYYCYDEGDEYEETFGTRVVSGAVEVRRSVTVGDGVLRRVRSPGGTYVVQPDGDWKPVAAQRSRLAGGQGTALRPASRPEKRRRFGVGPDGQLREDKHLPEITALIDREQFELITRPDSGVAAIRGGAGSGKTTVGLHRISFLNFGDPERYRPDRMIVVVYNHALEQYIGQVLPTLGLSGVRTATFGAWAASLRRRHLPGMPARAANDTPLAVSRAKKHPAMLHAAAEAATRAARGTSQAVTDTWRELLTDRGLLTRHLGHARHNPLQDHEVSHLIDWSVRQQRAIDEATEEEDSGWLDPEDDALLLLLHTMIAGSLCASSGHRLSYEHLMVDEVQDMSPVELAVLLSTCVPRASITLAGDAAQRQDLDSGFVSWSDLFDVLGLDAPTIASLRIGYRSTCEIMDVARDVLGSLVGQDDVCEATRSGAPVELLRCSHDGEAVAVLGEALRELAAREPLASVAVVARHPARADLYHDGLRRSEVPRLRRVADQDFSFRPGVEVTDVHQVKGLEFDYVVLIDADAASYPATDEARHLLHIGMTRAAHQLWLVCTGSPSPLLPAWLLA
jgi:DNA helicase-2/ATP-dependent DNA helicase PcrA